LRCRKAVGGDRLLRVTKRPSTGGCGLTVADRPTVVSDVAEMAASNRTLAAWNILIRQDLSMKIQTFPFPACVGRTQIHKG